MDAAISIFFFPRAYYRAFSDRSWIFPTTRVSVWTNPTGLSWSFLLALLFSPFSLSTFQTVSRSFRYTFQYPFATTILPCHAHFIFTSRYKTFCDSISSTIDSPYLLFPPFMTSLSTTRSIDFPEYTLLSNTDNEFSSTFPIRQLYQLVIFW